jgi:hypothetical protein
MLTSFKNIIWLALASILEVPVVVSLVCCLQIRYSHQRLTGLFNSQLKRCVFERPGARMPLTVLCLIAVWNTVRVMFHHLVQSVVG